MKSQASLLDTAQRLAVAEHQGDLAALELLLAADYQGYDPTGRLHDRAAVLRAYGEDGVRLTSVQLSELQAQILGEVGLVIGVSAMQGHRGAERLDFRLHFLDVYVWRDDRWELVASQNTRQLW